MLRIRPDYADAHNNLANTLHAQGRHEEASAHYLEVLRILPVRAEAHYNLAISLAQQGKTDEAIEHL